MSDAELELFDVTPDGDVDGRAGENVDAAELTDVGAPEGIPDTSVEEVDTSFLSQEARDALSGVDPKVRAVLAQHMLKERNEMRSDAGKKWEEAAAMRREAASQLEAMQKIVDGINAPGKSAEPTPSLASSLQDIDLDEPGGEEAFWELAKRKLGVDNLNPKDEIASAVSAHPVIRKAQLQEAATVARSSLDKPISDDMWRAITTHWAESKKAAGIEPLSATPETLYAELRSLAAIAGLNVKTTAAPKPPASTSAPSPSGGFAADTRRLHPAEREKRPMTDDEIFNDPRTGSLEDLKKDLAGMMGRSPAE